MSGATQPAALICVLLGLASAAAVVARRHDVTAGLAALLELLLAGSLLRLVGDPGWGELTGAAVVVALRRVLATAPARRGRQHLPRHRPVG